MTVVADMPRALAHADALYRDCLKMWQGLTAGPWVAGEYSQVDDGLLNELLALRYPGRQVRDYAAASVLRQQLVSLGFVTARRLENGQLIEWSKATTPPEPDTRDMATRVNDQLAAEVAREQAFRDQEFAARQAADKQLGDWQEQIEIGRLVGRLRDLGVPSRGDLDGLRQEIAELRSLIERNANTDRGADR